VARGAGGLFCSAFNMLRGGSTLLLAMINGCRVGVKKLLEFQALTHLRGLR
jgi:hypothetical protein